MTPKDIDSPVVGRRAGIATIFAALLLGGCQAQTPSQMSSNDRTLWTDPETGCRYIVIDEGFAQTRIYAITIRFKADGTADCPGASQ